MHFPPLAIFTAAMATSAIAVPIGPHNVTASGTNETSLFLGPSDVFPESKFTTGTTLAKEATNSSTNETPILPKMNLGGPLPIDDGRIDDDTMFIFCLREHKDLKYKIAKVENEVDEAWIKATKHEIPEQQAIDMTENMKMMKRHNIDMYKKLCERWVVWEV